MARESLVSVVANDLLNRIVSGEFPPDSPLPGENELTVRHDVSRLTVREAIKTLEARGVVRVQRGRGTYVNAPQHWTDIEALLRATAGTVGGGDRQLLQLRHILETGAAEAAAPRITAAELATLESYLQQMRAAHQQADVDAFVEADIAFHDVILHATGNIFIRVVFEPIKQAMREYRWNTSSVPQIQVHALAKHAEIIAALAGGDPEAARHAMASHIEQTRADVDTYVKPQGVPS